MQFLISKLFAFLVLLYSFLPQSTFIEGIVGQPQAINPLKSGVNSVDRDLTKLIFRGLMKYNDRGELIGDLAERYRISEDQKEYEIELRKGVFWHDGREFNADDVLFTVSEHPQLKAIQVDKLNRYVVRFRLRDPYAPLLDLLTLGIIPAHLGSSMKDLGPVGTGYYRLVRIKKSNRIDEIVLERSGSQDEKVPASNPSRLIFKFYSEAKDLITAARLGEVDGFSSEDYVEKVFNFNQYRVPLGSRYYALFLNQEKAPELKEKELRQNLASALPKERIVEEALKGAAVPSFLPLEYTFATASAVKRFRYRDDLPAKYDLDLTLTFPKKETHQKTAEIIRESLSKIGIRLVLNPVEPSDITSKVIREKNFQLLLLGQEIERDPDVYTLWHSTQKNLPGLNFINFESVLADKALEEGRKKNSLEDRIFHYLNFQKVFADEVPAIILYHPILTYSVRSSVSGISLQSLFKREDRFSGVGKWFFQD